MGVIFGKSRRLESRVTEQDRAVLQLKQQRDKVKQYQRRVEQSLERDRLLARKLLAGGRKDRAKLLLRKKRLQEQMLIKADGQLDNLERLVHDLEFSQVEMQVLDGLKTGNEALNKIHQVLSVEEVERIMDDTREAIDKQKELDELLSGALTAEDEEEVEAELEALVAASEPASTLPEVPVEEPEEMLPEVPTHEPQGEEGRKEKKRVALEAA